MSSWYRPEVLLFSGLLTHASPLGALGASERVRVPSRESLYERR
jgi:hypothetical protein